MVEIVTIPVTGDQRLGTRSFGVVGALAALPLRLAARAAQARGHSLRRGVGRVTSHVVFGRRLLALRGPAIEARLSLAGDRPRLSEAGFFRALDLLEPAEGAGISRRQLLEQSGLDANDATLLALFDAFEAEGPHTFRDVILARKYAGLIASGADWAAVARSVHRVGPVGSLTAAALRVAPGGSICAEGSEGLAELDGQMLLDLGSHADPDAAFEEAEAAEAAGDHETAVRLYGRCLALDPRDAVAAFNRANALRALARTDAATEHYLRAVRIDPGLVEAWFNLGCLALDAGRPEAARRHLERAVARDPGYADAIYNLASAAFAAGDLAAADRWWRRYLELDGSSLWARKARRGLAVIAAAGRSGQGEAG